MTLGTGRRQYRACQRCRQRKTRCDLSSIGEVGRPPCLDCFRTGQECTLAASRRGGNYTHYRKPRTASRPTGGQPAAQPAASLNNQKSPREAAADFPHIDDTRTPGNDDGVDGDDDDDLFDEELRNPSDALQMLSRSTDRKRSSVESESRSGTADSTLGAAGLQIQNDTQAPDQTGELSPHGRPLRGIKEYDLVAKGFLTPAEVCEMVQIYATKYHPYMPVVSDRIVAPCNINRVAREEAFLLTIVLTIASKDDFEFSAIHHHCCQHTKRLLLEVLLALPSTLSVGTVEGLLVLSEWLPYISLNSNTSTDSPNKTFPEDSTAWSLVGQAVRHAYLLRLDRTSFREPVTGENQAELDRKRLAWTFVYLADRQISVRMGQSFWSRGPSLSTKFTVDDFSNLQPQSEDDEDYASILQSTVELTQLLHNVHDIMYSSSSRTLSMILTGDYNRYLDDFHRGLLLWHTTWDGLDMSPQLRSTLTLMCEYLSLYANAFSFQAVITRSAEATRSQIRNQPKKRPVRRNLFPGGVTASPDGRYILDAVRSAKLILRTFNSMNPETHVRHLPFRYYLYGIYAAVFLFKANAFGALAGEKERRELINLIREFVTVMRRAAANKQHVGWRYSQLLMALWSKDPSTESATRRIQSQPTGTPSNVARTTFRSQPNNAIVDGRMNPTRDPNSRTHDFPIASGNLTEPQSLAGATKSHSDNLNFSAPVQMDDFDFPTPDSSWINMAFGSSQNLFGIDSPFGLTEMWTISQSDTSML